MRRWIVAAVVAATMAGCEGPEGPAGPAGPTLAVREVEGTILNQNYRPGNENFAALPLSIGAGSEPVILDAAIENANGVWARTAWASVIWAGDNLDFAVPGHSGWHVLIEDPGQGLVNRNYRVRFIQP